ncbi:Non-seed lectin, partial [Dissostichus eleginoides]
MHAGRCYGNLMTLGGRKEREAQGDEEEGSCTKDQGLEKVCVRGVDMCCLALHLKGRVETDGLCFYLCPPPFLSPSSWSGDEEGGGGMHTVTLLWLPSNTGT